MKKLLFITISILILLSSYSQSEAHSTECIARSDLTTNTLHVPCLEFNGNIYWADFRLLSWFPVQLQLIDYGDTTTQIGTGIIIQSVDVVGNDDTPENIDVANHICPDGEIEPINALHREDATMTITALMENPNMSTFPATVEECTITYIKTNDNIAAPLIDSWTIYPNCILQYGINSCLVNLIDIQRKIDFWDDITSAPSIPNIAAKRYIATYSCRYRNNFNQEDYFQAEYEIFLWDFETCILVEE